MEHLENEPDLFRPKPCQRGRGNRHQVGAGDADFAAGTVFGEPVAHGMLGASLISAVIGTRLPGPNSIYLGQQLRFVAPVRYGDTLTATCEVVHKRQDKPILKLRTTVTNQDGVVVTEGEAVVKKPR